MRRIKFLYTIIAIVGIYSLSMFLIHQIPGKEGEDLKSNKIVDTIEKKEDSTSKKPLVFEGDKEEEKKTNKENNEKTYVQQEIIVSEFAVTRALAAKTIALLIYNEDEITGLPRELKFTDCHPDEWYDKYVNALSYSKIIGKDKDEYRPYDFLTHREAKMLFEQLKASKGFIFEADISDNNEQVIKSNEWMTIILDIASKNKEKIQDFEAKNIIVLSTPMTSENLEAWKMETNLGTLDFSGLAMDQWIDTEIECVVKGQEIIGVLKEVSSTPNLENIYVSEVLQDKIKIFIKGVYKVYPYDAKSVEEKINSGDIIDVSINQGKIASITKVTEKIQGKIYSITGEYIEIDGLKYPIEEFCQLYTLMNGEIGNIELSQLIVGTDNVTFYVRNGCIRAIILETSKDNGLVRVCISTTEFKSLFHHEIELEAENGLIVEIGEKEYTTEKIFSTMNFKELMADQRAIIKPKVKEDGIKITTVYRGTTEKRFNPIYDGSLEITKTDKGYMIINEVDIEQYLVKVIPSEMPSQYGVEAAKIQAVTSRSYVFKQKKYSRYRAYGAHLDDTVNSQVYNNTADLNISKEAVQATKGLGLIYKNQVVSANFFSTSCGFTANSGEVWAHNLSMVFPNETVGYLTATKQFEDKTQKSKAEMKDEETFYNFIKGFPEEAYDRHASWFRWNVTMNREDIQKSIEANLPILYERRPQLIKTLGDDNIFRSQSLENGIGELLDLYVYKRGEGGIIMELLIVGSEKTVKVQTEYNIRKTIKPIQYGSGKPIALHCFDGASYNNFSIMPSAFYAMEKVKDNNGNLLKVNFVGGGYGHGVGMSQNGVKGMIDKGYNYKDILKHYYQDIEIGPIF